MPARAHTFLHNINKELTGIAHGHAEGLSTGREIVVRMGRLRRGCRCGDRRPTRPRPPTPTVRVLVLVWDVYPALTC